MTYRSAIQRGAGRLIAVGTATALAAVAFAGATAPAAQAAMCPVPGNPTIYSENTQAAAYPTTVVSEDGSTTVVAWHRTDDTTYFNQIQVAVSTDQGATFSCVQTISGGTGYAEYVDLAITPDGSTVAATWIADPTPGVTGLTQVYFAKSTDAGATWSAPVAVESFDFVHDPKIVLSSDGAKAAIAYWRYDRQVNPNSRVEVVSTSDGGATWSSPSLLSAATGDNSYPTISGSASGNRLAVAWLTRTSPTTFTVHTSSSSDAGATWSAEVEHSDPAKLADTPILRASDDGTDVVLVWHLGYPDHVIQTTVSHDGGSTWSSMQVLNDPAVASWTPDAAISSSGDTITVGWINGSQGALVTTSTDSGATWGTRTAAVDSTYRVDELVFDASSNGATLGLLMLDNNTGTPFWTTSSDTGQTWSTPSALDATGADDSYLAVSASGAGDLFSTAWLFTDYSNYDTILGSTQTLAPSTAPTVTSLSRTTGPLAGGTAVNITGTKFVSGATVTFGGLPATGVNVWSDTLITATSPAHVAGAVDVVVTNPDTQFGTLANGFTYRAAPSISTLTPVTGPTAGGTAVTITGSGFLANPTVTFGGVAATNVVRVSATTITARTPAHAAGAVTVNVTNTDGQFESRVNGFTYGGTPPVTKTITLAKGTRTYINPRRDLVVAAGVTTGIRVGARLTAMIKRGTDATFKAVKAKFTVTDGGKVTYKRRVRPGTTLTVYLVFDGVVSNKVTWKPNK